MLITILGKYMTRLGDRQEADDRRGKKLHGRLGNGLDKWGYRSKRKR